MTYAARTARTLVVLTIAVAMVALAGPAAADCNGPTITYEAGEVRRGTTVRVEGTGWGDACYDTGSPPAGEGILGEPVGEIQILLTQDGSTVVMAEGAADDDYTFSVDVPVPSWLRPGEATLDARWVGGESWDATDQPLVVTAEPALEGPDDSVVFGAQHEPSGTTGSGSGDAMDWLVPFLIGAALASAVFAFVLLLRPRTTVTRVD